MSRILRRPMFRGGPVDSRGTGITSGLMDGGRVGLANGGGVKTGGSLNPGIFGFKFDQPFLSIKSPAPVVNLTPTKDKVEEVVEEAETDDRGF